MPSKSPNCLLSDNSRDTFIFSSRKIRENIEASRTARTLRLTIAYDGTRYAGWQIQNSNKQHATSNRKPTIQGTLERVLRQILQERVTVVGSGRTDAGVHALSQVAHLEMRSTMPPARLRRSLNQLLPSDIALTRVSECHAPFHARFDAARKHYRYRIVIGEVVLPFIQPYVHQVRVPLLLSRMRREAAVLCGRHDFRAFARSGSDGGGTVRSVRSVRVSRRGQELHIDVVGNGFLHTMVRSMVGTLVDIGRGRLSAGTIRQMLRTRDRRLAGTTAPAKGLTLVSVGY